MPSGAEGSPRLECAPVDADGRTTDARLSSVQPETLFAEFEPLVQRLIHQGGSDPARRQFVAEAVYRRFCEALAAYDPSCGIPLRPFLLRRLSAPMGPLLRAAPERLTGEAAAGPHSDRSDGPEAAEVRNGLSAAIALLPGRQRAVVAARFYEGRSHAEIGSALGVSPTAVRSLLADAIRRMRRRLFRRHRPRRGGSSGRLRAVRCGRRAPRRLRGVRFSGERPPRLRTRP